VTWEKLKNVKIGFWGQSSCPFQLRFEHLQKIQESSEVVCKDPSRRMVRKFCELMSKWFYTEIFFWCLFRVDFRIRIKLLFVFTIFPDSWTCESSLCEVVKLWVVSKCVFISVENFQCWVMGVSVWNDGVSLLVLASLSLQVDCGYFEKSFGEFGMCLSAYLTNDVIFLIFWTVGCLLMSRLFIARFSACFVWILLKWHLWWWGVAVTCDLTWCLCKTVQN